MNVDKTGIQLDDSLTLQNFLSIKTLGIKKNGQVL